MCSCRYYISFMLLSSILVITCGKHIYSFNARVSSVLCLCYPSSQDQLYFRLCVNSLCSTFTGPVTWDTAGTEYAYNIITPTDYGTINKIQIVHTGDDQLCLDHVKIDQVEYDNMLPYCWDTSNIDGGCNTLIVTSSNDWSTSKTNPCEYTSVFNDTYMPTPIPTEPSKSPTNPSSTPTNYPTTSTNIPTTAPTILPTTHPSPPSYNNESSAEKIDAEHVKTDLIIIILSVSLVVMILIICGISFYCVYQRGVKKGMQKTHSDEVDNKKRWGNGEKSVLSVQKKVSSMICMDDEKELMDQEQNEGNNQIEFGKETDVLMNKMIDINNNEERDDMDELYIDNDGLSLIPGNVIDDANDNTPGVSKIGAMEMRKKVLEKVDSLDDLYEPTEDNTPGNIQNDEENAM